MVKIKDLHAFANSIVEILVGRSESMREPGYANAHPGCCPDEQQKAPGKGAGSRTSGQKTSAAKSQQQAPREMTVGSIPLDLIPLNWSKLPETQYIFKILSMCFGPYNTSGTLGVDTAEIYDQVHEMA